MVYPPQGIAGRHASTHEAGGLDQITGWIRPSLIGPVSDTAAGIQLRTRNIAGDVPLNHYIEPLDDAYGRIGRTLSAFSEITGRNIRAVDYFLGGGFCYQDWSPPVDNVFSLGKRAPYALRWKNVHAVTVTTGDLAFEETKCPVCGEPFKPQESLTLKVIEANGKETRTIPVHVQCNPHPTKLKMEEATPPKPNPLKEGEFEIIEEEIVDEEHMLLRAIFWDGTIVAAPVKIDASEEEVKEKLTHYYNLQKQRAMQENEAKTKGLKKKKREWKGMKGKM